MGNCQTSYVDPSGQNNDKTNRISRKKLVVVYGGPSVEHEVSCRSASFILKHSNHSLYDVSAVGVDQDGAWWPQTNLDFSDLPIQLDIEKIREEREGDEVQQLGVQRQNGSFYKNESFCGKASVELPSTPLSPKHMLFRLCGLDIDLHPDDVVLFPIVHGTHGEDGTLQGWCELAGVACVGPDTVGSAVAMDKVKSKQLVMNADIPSAPFVQWTKSQWVKNKERVLNETIQKVGQKLFVKPNTLGSSVGICKVKTKSELKKAIESAFLYDDKVLVEKHLENVREIECGILGGSAIDITCATPGEVIVHDADDFYSYDAKYLDKSKTTTTIPAAITSEQMKQAKDLSVKVANTLGIYGMSRIDWFLETNEDDDGSCRFYFNEANTLPGFTATSLYPQLWANDNVSGQDLVEKLISYSIDRANIKKNLHRKYQGET